MRGEINFRNSFREVFFGLTTRLLEKTFHGRLWAEYYLKQMNNIPNITMEKCMNFSSKNRHDKEAFSL